MADPPDDPRSDQALIRAINGGDSAAFEALYHRYRDWVINLASRFTSDREAALDVMQETFTYFLRKTPGFELRARFKTFLYPVVRHTAYAHQRKHRREITGADPPDARAAAPEPTDLRDPEDPNRRTRERLSEVLAALPEAQREVVLLRFVDGLTLEEIARAMRIPAGTVKSRLHHGLRTLRQDRRTRDYFER